MRVSHYEDQSRCSRAEPDGHPHLFHDVNVTFDPLEITEAQLDNPVRQYLPAFRALT
jgi:hypothetical protein